MRPRATNYESSRNRHGGFAPTQPAAEAILVFAREPRASRLTQLLANAAGAIGAPAQDLLPILVKLLDHRTRAVREASRKAIEQIVAALDREESQE